MWSRVQRGCVLLFSGVFGLLWCWLIFGVLVSFQESKKICLFAIFLLSFFGLLAVLFRKFFPNIWRNEKSWLVFSFMLFIIAAGLLYAGLSLRVRPSWDFGAVYQGAAEIAESGTLSEQSNWYFTTYPNNMTVCMFLAVCFKMFGGICSYITLGVWLNVFLMVLGMGFLFLLVRRLYGVRSGFLSLMLCALFLPFYMHAAIFYTDTFALPFVTGTFLCYQFRKRDIRFLLLTAVVLGLGYKVKGSLGVILIALLIHIWLQREKTKKRITQSIMLLAPFLFVIGFLTILPGQLSFLDTAEVEKNEFPVEHWLAMGLAGHGGYNADVYWMTASIEGKEEKREVDRAFIQKQLGRYGIWGMKEHLKEKILFTWGDGVYFAPEKLKREPLQESPLHSWVLDSGIEYKKTYQYCSAVHFLLLLGIFLSIFCNVLRKGDVQEALAVQIAVFGLFLFLLIWETRSRYLVNFVPMFILLGIDGGQELGRYLKKAFRKHEDGEGVWKKSLG